jgi:Tol biopolymer transport system component
MRARFSPDGRNIVYDSDRTGNFEIWLLDLANKSQRPLTSHPSADMAPDWSPDGREVVFISNREGIFQLWIADTATGACRRITEAAILAPAALNHGSATTAQRWSPDGRKIGFLVKDTHRAVLWSVDPDGRNARQMIRGALDFDWYRDSAHILYTRLSPDGSGVRELTLMDIFTGAHEVLYRGPHVEVAAARDGSRVTFVHARSHFSQNLYSIRLGPLSPGGSLPQRIGTLGQLTESKGRWHAHHGSYSLDSKSIVYTRDLPEADVLMIKNYR